MKHIFCCLLACLISSAAWAQLVKPPKPSPFPPELISGWQRMADSLLAPLDKSSITGNGGTNVLYDRVAGLAALDVFNLANSNPDTASHAYFLQAYYELRSASYVAVAARPTREDLRSTAQYYARRDTVLLAALRYRLQYIDSNAVRNNQLRWETTVGSRLFDVLGRTGSPYLQRENALAAALADSTRSGFVTFTLPSALTLGNTGIALQNASILFDDGLSEQLLLPNQSRQVSYSSPGVKTLRFRLTYSDGRTFTTYSTLYVPRAACTTCRTTAAVENPCRTEPVVAKIDFQGRFAESQAGYYYATTPAKPCNGNSTNVTKPVILLDGIDYEDERDPARLYSEYLSYADATGENQNLGTELRRAGHDVVVLNFPNLYTTFNYLGFPFKILTLRGGADYMERNAFALVELIQRLNLQLQAAGSTEQITIVGPSMGGQIARYALAYMERNGIQHNTRLYLSLDSPHNGATIPLSLQHFVKRFADFSGDGQLVAGLGQLDSPAARELTQHHYTQGTGLTAHPDRVNFMNQLGSFGSYPSQPRRVTVVNGALNGTSQRDQNGRVIQDEEQALFFEQRGIPRTGLSGTVVRVLFPIGLVGRLITTASARLYYGPGQGQTVQVLRSYILTGGGQRLKYATGPANSCGSDGAPGGYRNFFKDIYATETSGGVHFFQRRNFYSERDKACFIPVTSGLGLSATNSNNCATVTDRNLICTQETPFDAYYGPQSVNEEHVQLTAGNVQFMRNEILRLTPAPVFLQAPTALCPNGGTSTFQVQGECSRLGSNGQPLFPITYTWTLTGPAVFAGNNTQTISGPATQQPIRSTAADGLAILTVTAQRAGFAVSTPVTHYIQLTRGEVYLDLDLQGQQKVCPYTTVVLRVRGVNAQAGPYTWTQTSYRNGQPIFSSSFTTTDPELAVSVDENPIDYTVTAASVCDGQPLPEGIRTITPYVDPNGGFYCDPNSFRVAIYPNPADSNVEITALADEATTATRNSAPKNRPFQVYLYDDRGREKLRASTENGTVQLDTQMLPTGLYHLTIRSGKQQVRRNLSIQH